jgi:hypothetical protein
MYIHVIMPRVQISTTHYGTQLQLVFLIMIFIDAISKPISVSLVKY